MIVKKATKDRYAVIELSEEDKQRIAQLPSNYFSSVTGYPEGIRFEQEEDQDEERDMK